MTLPPEHADATYEIFNFTNNQCIIASTEEAGAKYTCGCGRKFEARSYHKIIVDYAPRSKDHFTWQVRWEYDTHDGRGIHLTQFADKVMTLREIYNEYYRTPVSVFDEIGNFNDVTSG